MKATWADGYCVQVLKTGQHLEWSSTKNVTG